MADNFDMKQFLMENKLGAYSRLKENEEQLNEYEVTYEYGSDGGCYRVDDEGNYDEVDDSMCKKYAGQGVREDKKEVEESLDDEDAGGIETDIEMDLAYAENPIVYLKSIIDFCTKKIKEIEQNGSEDSEMQEAKKEEIKEALTPEMFERMDAVTSTHAQIAMIKAAEIMMNELTEEGFEVLDIREYFTQLIANDI